MGEANRRGTFAERVERAKARAADERAQAERVAVSMVGRTMACPLCRGVLTILDATAGRARLAHAAPVCQDWPAYARTRRFTIKPMGTGTA